MLIKQELPYQVLLNQKMSGVRVQVSGLQKTDAKNGRSSSL
jgi:hypothetical protein